MSIAIHLGRIYLRGHAYYIRAVVFDRRRLMEPPLRPAAWASSLVHLCAVPIACAAFPPLLAISRFFSALIDAKPRPRPFFVCIVCSPCYEVMVGSYIHDTILMSCIHITSIAASAIKYKSTIKTHPHSLNDTLPTPDFTDLDKPVAGLFSQAAELSPIVIRIS